MTGTATAGPDEHPLLPGASPATIRSFLLPEDRPKFVASYEAALDEARRTLDPTPVHEVIGDFPRGSVEPYAERRRSPRASPSPPTNPSR